MRKIILIVTTVLMMAGVASAVPTIDVKNRKFDHKRHEASAKAKGKAPDCAGCHLMNAAGVPAAGREHNRCNSCHGPSGGNMSTITNCATMQTSGPGGPARVCSTCHTPTRPQCLPGDLPGPFAGASPYASKFPHGKHVALKGFVDCGQCHKDKAPTPPPAMTGHQICGGCHNTKIQPAMNQCLTCHIGATAKTVTGPDPFRLGNFDHKAHHAASKLTAKCQNCHTKLTDADLPRPSMPSCMSGGCHDGKTGGVFNAVGTTCTKCHKGSGKNEESNHNVGFSHTEHAKRSVAIANCAACHKLEPDGKLSPPLIGKDHQPCANTVGCHQNDFMARAPKTCGTCHVGTSPWVQQVARYRPSTDGKPSEYFESINHQKHIPEVEKKLAGNAVCVSCHGDKFQSQPKPGAHKGCIECHGRGTKPDMSDCAGCHLSTPPAKAVATEWSVRATFASGKADQHIKHRFDPRGRSKDTACLECHASTKTAANLAAIKPPQMSQCEGCHNGKNAFKTTGFECSRCHQRAQQAPATTTTMLVPFTKPEPIAEATP